MLGLIINEEEGGEEKSSLLYPELGDQKIRGNAKYSPSAEWTACVNTAWHKPETEKKNIFALVFQKEKNTKLA